MFCEYSLETTVHQLAKEVILEEKGIWLPNNSEKTNLFDLKIEKPLGKFIPDVQGVYLKNGIPTLLVIEVCVTSPSSFKKVDFYRKNSIDAIEIKIKQNFDMDIFDIGLLMDHIWGEMTNPKNQTWLSRSTT